MVEKSVNLFHDRKNNSRIGRNFDDELRDDLPSEKTK